jgi:hypothetical protein
VKRKDRSVELQEESPPGQAKEWRDDYSYLVGLLVFIGSWVYCIYTYGFLLGGGLGLIPSIIAAIIATVFWPFIIIISLVYWVLLNWN